MNRKFYLIPAAFILLLCLFAGVTRTSYTDIGKGFLDYPYVSALSDEDVDKFFLTNELSTYAQIPDRADVIVKCKVNNGQKITSDAFYTPVQISAVYKGNKGLSGHQIQIIEPITIDYRQKQLTSLFGYVPLQTGKEYILFLNKKEWDPNKRPSDFENSQYYITTNSAFGVFSAGNQKQVHTIPDNAKSYTAHKVYGTEIFTSGSKILNNYYELKSSIWKKYHI